MSTDTATAIRTAAWQQAVALHKQWDAAVTRSSGGRGGAGYRDPLAHAEVKRLRTLLDEVIVDHGFQGSKVDPMTDWFTFRSLPWTCPPVTEVEA